MRSDSRLRPVPADYDPSWIIEGVLPFASGAVGSLVPVVFESYGRVFHPARLRSGAVVRWDTVAAWAGRTMHALAQFGPLSPPRDDTVVGARPFELRPDDGALPFLALRSLCDVLASHTTTPSACLVGVWEGRGWPELRRFQTLRLQLPERLFIVLEGPIDAVEHLGWSHFNGSFVREAPSIIWPADRAWFISTDVDQDSTYLGGTIDLVEALVADDRLEVWRVDPRDPITADGDTINLP